MSDQQATQDQQLAGGQQPGTDQEALGAAWAGWVFSVGAAGLLAAHQLYPKSFTSDPLTIVLLVGVALPWIPVWLQSAKLPGGTELVFLKRQVREHGRTIEQQQQQVNEQERKIEEQQEIINRLVKYSMSASIFRHLCGIALLKEYRYSANEAFKREMYFLRDNGYIAPKSDAFLDFDDGLNHRNLVEIAVPTPVGLDAVRLRKNEIPADWLTDKAGLSKDLSIL